MLNNYPLIKFKNISEKLVELGKRDQDARNKYLAEPNTTNQENMLKIDSSNQRSFKKIFAKTGYIDHRYGKEAQLAAFLIVQHMPKAEVSLMKKYRDLMRESLENIDKNHYALLTDRIETLQNKPQIYGTQFAPIPNTEKKCHLKPLHKPEEVDTRRKELGLESLKKYMEKISKERGVTLIH